MLFVSGLDVTGRDGITRDETEYVRVAWPDIYAVKYQVVLEILTTTGSPKQTQNVYGLVRCWVPKGLG